VAAGAPNLESYTDNGDGTVTDNITGLVWQQAVATTTNDAGASSSYAWSDAAAYCATLTLSGHNDWRMPSLIELESIVDYGQTPPSINGTFFPSTPASLFWSSFLVTGSTSIARGISFYQGRMYDYDITSARNVRCVR
jgi:hypothetical protein